MREIQKSSRYNNYIKAIKLIKLKRKAGISFLQKNLKKIDKILSGKM